MRIPGFNAEASVYRTTAHYAMGPRDTVRRGTIVPHAAGTDCPPCHCPNDNCCIVSSGGWCRCGCPPEAAVTETPTLLRA
jgi:hypothetical protein